MKESSYSKVTKCGICREKRLTSLEARDRGYCARCLSKAIQIDPDEWHCNGCFIQKSDHPCLFGRYEVFKDDKYQTHIGRYNTFREAKRAAKENRVTRPINMGYLQYKIIK